MGESSENNTTETARVWARIDLKAVRHNTRALLRLLKNGAELMAVVKAAAYGHGSEHVAKAALEAGATRLGVNDVAEGAALRAAGIVAPIHILTSCLKEELTDGILADLTFAVSCMDEVKALADRSRALNQGRRTGTKTKVHLLADTGMGRSGFSPGEVLTAASWIKEEKRLDLEGIFTHFSSAEEKDEKPTAEQVDLFRELVSGCGERGIHFRLRHAANSAGTVFHPKSQLDLVRCGVLLHGLRGWQAARDTLDLLPSLSLHARILHIGRYPPRTTVGYGRLHVCEKESLLATLPVGYCEGYSRELTGCGHVIIRGVRVPVVGRVSMNQIVADVTALDQSDIGAPEAGEEATLIGGAIENRITVEEVAENSKTIPYVVTTQMGANVKRVYAGVRTINTVENGFEMRTPSVLVEKERITPRKPIQHIASA
ncbi:MAG: alanine racemase [Planctomycetota bacterium]